MFTVYSLYDSEANDYISMMHVYKRNLTPIKEQFSTCSQHTPYQSNLEKYKQNLIQSNFNQEYLNSHQDVVVSSKSKHFTTFSIIINKQNSFIEEINSPKWLSSS